MRRFGLDSALIENVLPLPDEGDMLTRVLEEVNLVEVTHKGGAIPRLFAVQGIVQVAENAPIELEPVYRHPMDFEPALQPMSPLVLDIKRHSEASLVAAGYPPQEFNHVLIQLYRDGRDHISEHCDKTLDIASGSAIANFSLGRERIMVLRSKEGPGDGLELIDEHDHDGIATASVSVPVPAAASSTATSPTISPVRRHIERVPLMHNSLFVLGTETNRRYLHSIKPDKSSEALAATQAGHGRRLSFTFRTIATFRDRSTGRLVGQGACMQSDSAAEQEALFIAFRTENKTTLPWEEIYGGRAAGIGARVCDPVATLDVSAGTGDVDVGANGDGKDA